MSDINLPSSADTVPDAATQVVGAVQSPGADKARDVGITNADREASEVLGFRPQDRQVLTVVMTLLLLWLSAEWILVATRRPDPLLLQRGTEFQAHFRVHVNDAIWVDWMQLEGIGPSLAHRIVADRRLNGPFSSIEDVARVPGIGPETLDRIRPWLTMGHDANESGSHTDTSQRPSERQPATGQRQPTAL